MKPSYFLVALALSLALAAVTVAQPEGNRSTSVTPVATTDGPAVHPGAPPIVESQSRRDEQSVDLEVLLTRVSAMTGLKFLVDPHVEARVYAVPKIDNPSYAELLAVLRMNGYMAAVVGRRVNIVPESNSRYMPVRLMQVDNADVPDDEVVTRIVVARNAPQLVPVLRPLMPPSAHLAAVLGDDQSKPGKLILMDTYANVRRMTELINALAK